MLRILHLFTKSTNNVRGGADYYIQALMHYGSSDKRIMMMAACSYDTDGHRYHVHEKIYQHFEALLQYCNPNIIHFHSFDRLITTQQIDIAKKQGIRTIITFHQANLCSGHSSIDKYGKPTCGSDFRCAYLRLRNAGHLLPVALFFSMFNPTKGSLPARYFKFQRMARECKEGINHVLNHVDMVHIHAKWMLDILVNKGADLGKIKFIDLGIPSPSKIKSSNQLNHPMKIAYAGRLVKNKGIEVFVKAIKMLPKSIGVRVYIYGHFPNKVYEQRIRNLIGDDEKFEEIGSISNDQMVQRLSQVDLSVVPSTEAVIETGPLSVLESFAARTPVIGTNLGGIAERIHDGVDGILFPPSNSKQLSLIIKRLVENTDEVLKMKRNIQTPRTMEDVAIDMSELYSEMINEKKNEA